MSFWSSLVLARGGQTPAVTVAAIGALVRGLTAAQVLVGDEQPLCQIKYGPRVDADEQTTHEIEWDGLIGTYREYPWDRSGTYPSLPALADALAADNGTVYRAFLSLGSAHPDIVAALTREPSEENEVGLCLCGVSLQVGPIVVAGLGSESSAFVGWMGLVFSGPGYFFPWEYRRVRERAEEVALVRRAAALCRSAWPVEPVLASAEAVAARRELSDLWLYDDFALPQNWRWFVSESG